MNKRYWWIILIYILAQLSGIIGLPLLAKTGWYDSYDMTEKLQVLAGHWALISFSIASLLILWLLRGEGDRPHHRLKKADRYTTAVWIIVGGFLAYVVQIIAANIEAQLFGIEPGSENTQQLVQIAALTKSFIIVIAILAPVLEEIVFRKILFGALYKRYNFFISAVISSLLFGVVHGELSHLLIYTSMGLVFAFLYVQTGRIIVPIAAHVTMNTIVVIFVLLLGPIVERLQPMTEKIQAIFGGF